MVINLNIKDSGSVISAIHYLIWTKLFTEVELANILGIPPKTFDDIRIGCVEPSVTITTKIVQLFYNISIGFNQFLLDMSLESFNETAL